MHYGIKKLAPEIRTRFLESICCICIDFQYICHGLKTQTGISSGANARSEYRSNFIFHIIYRKVSFLWTHYTATLMARK